MPFWVYGLDSTTGEPGQFLSDAETAEVAREQAMSQGLVPERVEVYSEIAPAPSSGANRVRWEGTPIMVAIITISLLLILLMSLFPPWRGRKTGESPEVDAGYAFVLAPPKESAEPPNSVRRKWVGIRIDAGRLMAQCFIVATVAGLLIITFHCYSPPAREEKDKLDLMQ